MAGSDRMTGARILLDLAVAVVVVLAGGALAWAMAGGLPWIGIDDAAITRSYAENIANGLGYVYNAGGERVEGSTTLLWTMIVAAFYVLTPDPEHLIVALCSVFTVGAVFAALRIARDLTDRAAAPGDVAVAAVALFLLANPGYFFWTVWSMMEAALWSASVLWLVAALVAQVGSAGRATGRLPLALFAPALMLPLVRPEGIAVAIGLLVVGALLAPGLRRRAGVAIALCLAVFALVTGFRLWYFGQPFPNTFYAKVSSDRLQDLVEGAKYAASFVLGAPFAEMFIAAWAGATIWVVVGALRGRHVPTGLLVPAAAVLGFLAVYAGLGGDHFVLWRFYQPVFPLLPLALAVGLALATGTLRGHGATAVGAVPALVVSLAVLGTGWLHYYQARFDVRKEFTLVEQGLEFGRYLNTVTPQPSIGVGPAGGIALAYDGFIYDLLGLNWTAMAHANPIKVGMRNHASFDKPTFWAHRPDVVATFNRACTAGATQTFWAANDDAFDGLFGDPRFRDEFVPVRFHGTAACWPGFATSDWLARRGDVDADADGVEILAWSDLVILD